MTRFYEILIDRNLLSAKLIKKLLFYYFIKYSQQCLQQLINNLLTTATYYNKSFPWGPAALQQGHRIYRNQLLSLKNNRISMGSSIGYGGITHQQRTHQQIQEIDYAIKSVKLKFPEMNIHRAIEVLHKRVQTFKNQQEFVKQQKQIEKQGFFLQEEAFNHPKFQIREIIPKVKLSKSKTKSNDNEERDWLKQQPQPSKDAPLLKQTIYDRFSPNDGRASVASKINKPQVNDNLQRCLLWDFQANNQAYRLYCNKVAPKFNTQEEEERYFEKRLAAQAFYARGYGLNKLKAEFFLSNQAQNTPELAIYATPNALANCTPFEAQPPPSNYRFPDKKRYKTVSTAFIGEAFRRMQSFVRDNIDKSIRPFTGAEMRALFSILLNCENFLPTDEFCMFRRFIKVTFDLGSVSIYDQTVKRLYRSILLSLKERTSHSGDEGYFQDKKQRVKVDNVISRRRTYKNS